MQDDLITESKKSNKYIYKFTPTCSSTDLKNKRPFKY